MKVFSCFFLSKTIDKIFQHYNFHLIKMANTMGVRHQKRHRGAPPGPVTCPTTSGTHRAIRCATGNSEANCADCDKLPP